MICKVAKKGLIGAALGAAALGLVFDGRVAENFKLSSGTWVHVGAVRVNVAPPPVRVEQRAPAPSPQHVWVDGYWSWRGGQHVWLGGTWLMPPAPGYVWQPAQWVNENGAWVFYEGYWRDNGGGYEPPPGIAIDVTESPPQDLVEVQPPMPFGGAVWVPGYWHWAGHRHVWVGGRWVAPPHGKVWVPGHWQHKHHGWRYKPGHWR